MENKIINPNIAYFKEGEVYVYTLPEEPNFEKFHWKILCDQARLRAIKVDKKDVEKIKIMIKALPPKSPFQKFETWQPQDLTEYRIEVKMSIDNYRRYKLKSGIWGNWQKTSEHYYLSDNVLDLDAYEFEQVACLIEDDVKETNPKWVGEQIQELNKLSNVIERRLKELEDDKQ